MSPRRKARAYAFYVVLPPAFFLALLVSINSSALRKPVDKWGDVAADGLEIERAKSYQAYLGPHSHLEEFHHAGPINFYYYAYCEKLFRFFTSYHGSHMLAQLILNCLFMAYCLHVVYRYMSPPYLTFVLSFCLIWTLIPLGNQPYMSVWTLDRVIAPAAAFLVAAVCIALGNLKHILPFLIAVTFLLQNHIGTSVLVVPLSAAAVTTLLIRIFRHAGGLVSLNWKYAVASVVFLSVAFAPVAIEQLTAEDGNISKICRFIAKQPTLEHHGVASTVKLLFSYYEKPITGITGAHIKPIRVLNRFSIPLRNIALFLIFILINSLLLFNWLGGKNRFASTASLFVVLSALCTLYYALFVRGPQHYSLFSYFYSDIGLAYFFACYALMKLMRIDRVKRAGLALVPLACVGISWLTFSCFRFERPKSTAAGDLNEMVEFIGPSTKVAYVLKFKKHGRHHMQWMNAVALALKLTRRGYRVYVPDEWLFQYGGQFSLANNNDEAPVLPIYFFNPDVTESEIASCAIPDPKIYRDAVSVVVMGGRDSRPDTTVSSR